jgi:hypothetical protein
MNRRRCGLMLGAFLLAAAPGRGDTHGTPLLSMPPIADYTMLYDAEVRFGYRGKVGVYAMPPSMAGTYFDPRVRFQPEPAGPEGAPAVLPVFPPVLVQGIEELLSDGDQPVEGTLVQRGAETAAPGESICIQYNLEPGPTFCGAYVILLANLTNFPCLSFMIRGERGGETFELGLNDTISNKREDAVIAGSIHRYLPAGITTNWQKVVIPLGDFFGTDRSRVFSLVFQFNEVGRGRFWVDDFRFHGTQQVDRERDIRERGHLLADDFDHSDVNLLGQKCGTYKKLPSVCRHSRVTEPRWGPVGRSLKLEFDRKGTGWCGYYTLLNEIDGRFYDLTGFESVAFRVRGEQGGERFELGMADRNWMNIGDSLKAGAVTNYLPDGVTTNWQPVTIPLTDFGALDFSEMGAFVINFHEKGGGIVYVDDLKFVRKDAARDGGPK